MLCHVYRSTRRPDTYVYLRERDAFVLLPDALRERLGALVHAMDLELTAERKLAHADTARVLANLAASGYHLQLPPAEARLDAPR